jgi:hypothetical protein
MGREKDCSSSRAENGLVVRGKFLYGCEETFFLEKLELSGAFAAGKNERIALFEVSYGADFQRFSAERLQHRGVGSEVALDGEDSDFGF